jgi:hypothetical protein
MSVYSGDKLSYLIESLESLYIQMKYINIHIWLDGVVCYEIKNYLYMELEKGNIYYIGSCEKNRGLAHSLNALLQVVMPKYEYIARMDADDICLVNRFEKQLLFMQNHPAVDVIGGCIEEFSDANDYYKQVCYPLTHEEMFSFFKKRVPLAHVSAFFRKSFFEKAGLYPTSSLTNEDTLLWMNGFKNGCQFTNLDEVVVKVRVSSSFFHRRGGLQKAWSDFKDRLLVIKSLGYNTSAYMYAFALFLVNISPAKIKRFLYKRFR